ncbi:MAG: CheR family methyltransferase [Candidatus Hodarchaeota archaeon]
MGITSHGQRIKLFDSKEGLTELKTFLKQKGIRYSSENELRITKRLTLLATQFDLDSYSELNSLLRNEPKAFEDLLKWLERGRTYNEEKQSFTPLIRRIKTEHTSDTLSEDSIDKEDQKAIPKQKGKEHVKKHAKQLESHEGIEELVDFLNKQHIKIDKVNEPRVTKRLELIASRLGFNDFTQLLSLLKSDPDTLVDVLDWLERGKIYDEESRSFTPLVQSVKGREKPKRRKKTQIQTVLAKELISVFPEPVDTENLLSIYDFLTDSGINFKAYKEKYFIRRLHRRMMRVDTQTYRGYIEYLEKYPDELDKLIDSLSINFTRFFRDKDVFLKLEQEIYPQIFKEDSNSIKIWSAGCAIGSEPYSIAIQVLESGLNLERIHLLATDISQDLLNRARIGLYPKDLLQEMTSIQIKSFFTSLDEDLFQINPMVRNLVKFKIHDLRTPPPFKNVDLIFCRNVLIYFSRPQAEILFKNFYEALKHKGFLVIGKTEVIPIRIKGLFKIVNSGTRIFQRQ